MIIDYLRNLTRYGCRFGARKILEMAAYAEQAGLQDGRYDVWGDDLYMVVQRYDTRPEEACRMESHQAYIDLQYIQAGSERLRWENTGCLGEAQERAGDSFFYPCPPQAGRLLLRAGMFALFLPEDAHMPCVAAGRPAPVKKLLFKIRASLT